MVPAPAMTCTNCPRPSSRDAFQKWDLDSALERDCEINLSRAALVKAPTKSFRKGYGKGLQNVL